MILPLLLAALQAGPPDPAEARFDRCVAAAHDDPVTGAKSAIDWQRAGGGFVAAECLGIAYTVARHWASAADAFENAARGAEAAKDRRMAYYWSQAGNAWLAGGEAVKARAALDGALAAGTLGGLELGEAYLDRARTAVAIGDPVAARSDLDKALADVPADPLAWLLSATLARRVHDLPRARSDIAEALKLASDDASVQLEAGNIAASQGDEPGAKAAWQAAATARHQTDASSEARVALRQFDPAPPAR